MLEVSSRASLGCSAVLSSPTTLGGHTAKLLWAHPCHQKEEQREGAAAEIWAIAVLGVCRSKAGLGLRQPTLNCHREAYSILWCPLGKVPELTHQASPSPAHSCSHITTIQAATTSGCHFRQMCIIHGAACTLLSISPTVAQQHTVYFHSYRCHERYRVQQNCFVLHLPLLAALCCQA